MKFSDVRALYPNFTYSRAISNPTLSHPTDDGGNLVFTAPGHSTTPPRPFDTYISIGRYDREGNELEFAHNLPVTLAEAWIDSALARAAGRKTWPPRPLSFADAPSGSGDGKQVPAYGYSIDGTFVHDAYVSENGFDHVDPLEHYGLSREEAEALKQANEGFNLL